MSVSDEHLLKHNVKWSHERAFGTEKYCICRVCNITMSVREIKNHLLSEHPKKNPKPKSMRVSKRPGESMDHGNGKNIRLVSCQDLLNVLVPLCVMLKGKMILLCEIDVCVLFCYLFLDRLENDGNSGVDANEEFRDGVNVDTKITDNYADIVSPALITHSIQGIM